MPDPSESPLDAVRRMLWHFWEFSVEQPQYFALMFLDRSVPSIQRVYEHFAFAQETKHELMAHLQRAIDEGTLPKSVAPAVAFRLLVTALIGVATMRLSDRLSPGENADDLARDALEVTLAGLQSGVAFRSQPGCRAIPPKTVIPSPSAPHDRSRHERPYSFHAFFALPWSAPPRSSPQGCRAVDGKTTDRAPSAAAIAVAPVPSWNSRSLDLCKSPAA